jgi:DNA-binding NarL/FixJ family response regulator
MHAPSQRAAVLLDQHPLWLDAVEQVLARIGIDVVGRASAPREALTLIGRHEPDLFITELCTGDDEADAFTHLREARAKQADLRIVVLSTYDAPPQIEAALASGATAYVLKTAHSDDLAAAVRQAFENSFYFADSRGVQALETTRPEQSNGARPADLTKREIEILRLVSEGHSNAELSRMLWVTEQTVKFHLSNIYRKLNVSNRTEASRWAHLHGVLTPAPSVDMSAAT